MGIVKRQFFKASAATYVGVVLGYLNITILFPYFCTPEQLGLYRVIINMATMFAAIAYMGTPQTIIKQFPLFKKQKQNNEFYGLLGIMFLFTLALSILLLIFLEDIVITFFSDKSPEVGEYYFYSVYIAFTLAIYVIFISNVRLIRRVAFPSLLKDVFLRILILADILLLGFGFVEFQGFVLILCTAYTVLAISAAIYSFRLVPFSVSFKINRLKKKDINDTLSFSILTFLASVSNIIIMNADSLMITAYAKEGLTDTGIYTIAFFIGSVLEIPRRIIILVTAPIISEYWTESKVKDIDISYKQTSSNAIILGTVLFGLIWLNLNTLYLFIPNSEIYVKGLNVVLFILIARLFELVFALAPNIITQSKYYYYNLPLSIILVALTIGLNYLLIPQYGIIGAGIATMLSIIIYHSLKIGLVWYYFKLFPLGAKAFRLISLFVILLLLNSYLTHQADDILVIILKNIGFLGLMGLFAWYDNSSEDFNKMIDKAFKMIKGK